MYNFLTKGYKIERTDGTSENYYGWSVAEICDLEQAYHNNDQFRVVCKVYEIENEFHCYTYNEINGTFRDYNETTDDITELVTDHAIADYLWKMATEADEDSVRAYRLIAVDIFGDFEKWRAYAFWHMMIDFERDVNYLKEVTA